MKVEINPMKFAPVMVTCETEFELELVSMAMDALMDAAMGRPKVAVLSDRQLDCLTELLKALGSITDKR